MSRADLLTGENAWGCLVALPHRPCSLPGCVRPGLERSLSVPPTAAPATPPRRPPAGAEGERSPGICRPPPSRPSRPAAPPAAKHTDLPPHPGFPRLFKGWPLALRKAGFPARTFPRRLPAGCPSNRSFKRSGDPGTSQLRPARPGEGQPVSHHKPRPGGTGERGGKANKAGSSVWSRARCRTGGTDVPYPPHRSGGTSPGGSCPLPPAAGVSSPAPSRHAAPRSPPAAPCLPTVDGMQFYIGNEGQGEEMARTRSDECAVSIRGVLCLLDS